MISSNKSFRGDEGGNVAIAFAIVLLPLVAVAGGALDYVKFLGYRRALEATAEQVANTTVSGDNLTEMARREKGRQLLRSVFTAQRIDPTETTGKVDVRVTGEDAEATVTIDGSYKLVFGAVIGLSRAKLNVVRKASNRASDQERQFVACETAESDETYEKLGCDGV